MRIRYGQFRHLFAGLLFALAVALLAACGGGAAGGDQASAPAPAGNEPTPSGSSSSEENQPSEPEKPDFPTQPIKIIVTHSAGGSTDTPPRLLAPYAEKILGQPVVLENMTGAGGNIARNFVWKAEPDGYTLLASQSPSMDSGKIVTGGEFEPMGFKHVFNIAGKNYNATAVRADSPYQTLQDLIDAAKANPGQLSVAGTGIGSNAYISVKLMERSAGVQFNYVPFDSGPESEAAVLGGQTDAANGNLGNFINKPDLRVLAVYGPERDERAPDIPTARELGIDASLDQLTGIFAPPDTPDEIVQILADAFAEAAEDPEFQKALENSDNLPAFMKTDEFRAAHQEINDAINAIADALVQN